MEEKLRQAAEWVRQADGLLLCAGAGMGVDSGLPDFRSKGGLWRTTLPFLGGGMNAFFRKSNPSWFKDKPAEAWEFYGGRLQAYRHVQPHEGFNILRKWSQRCPMGSFIYTSNVDEHFQKAGFSPSRIVECHGALMDLQCTYNCHTGIWRWDGVIPERVGRRWFQSTTQREAGWPRCPRCKQIARPNVLLFGDFDWIDHKAKEQHRRFAQWLSSMQGKRLVIIESGAGTAIPTVRMKSEQYYTPQQPNLIRINPTESMGPFGTLSLHQGALSTIKHIDKLIR